MKIILYTTLGCHLCEQALGLLQHCQARGRSFIIESVEISDSDDLVARYSIRIPVISTASQGQELGWPFDLESLEAFLDKPAAPN